jgi:type IV pilus assembly protein PilC
MPIFQWKARTRQGSLKKGEIEAMNEAAVMAQLRSQMLLPVTVKEKSKDVSEYLPFLKQGIKTRELVIFTRQFATMIDAGLPLVQCLDILGNQQPNKTFQTIIRTVKADVEQGSTFADALRKHPKPYDELYVNLGPGRRDRRHPRHDPEPARGLPREGGQAREEGEGRDGVSRPPCS